MFGGGVNGPLREHTGQPGDGEQEAKYRGSTVKVEVMDNLQKTALFRENF